MTTVDSRSTTKLDFKVADLELAEWGRKEIELAEVEMPGLVACREEYGPRKPLKGARITGSLHMTIQTAVLIETLVDLGARSAMGELQHLLDPGPRRGRGRGRSHRHAEEARGVPVFAWKGESLEEYWWCTEQALRWPEADASGSHGPNMLLDDGGDATLLIHKGVEFEKAGKVPDPKTADNDEFAVDPRCARSPAQGAAEVVARSRREREGRHRGDHHRRAPALPDARSGHAACSRPSTSTTP